MSKPGADPSSGISLGHPLRLPRQHTACVWRDAQSGSCMERENLAGDVKGRGASGSNQIGRASCRERGEISVGGGAEEGEMVVGGRGQVIADGSKASGKRRRAYCRRKEAALGREDG